MLPPNLLQASDLTQPLPFVIIGSFYDLFDKIGLYTFVIIMGTLLLVASFSYMLLKMLGGGSTRSLQTLVCPHHHFTGDSDELRWRAQRPLQLVAGLVQRHARHSRRSVPKHRHHGFVLRRGQHRHGVRLARSRRLRQRRNLDRFRLRHGAGRSLVLKNEPDPVFRARR